MVAVQVSAGGYEKIQSSVTPWKEDQTVEARLMIILKRDKGQFCIYVKQMNEMDKQVDQGSFIAI